MNFTKFIINTSLNVAGIDKMLGYC